MNGQVDGLGRALLRISIRCAGTIEAHDVQAWIDTGFNGDLVLPQPMIERFGLPMSGTIKAILADGSQITLQRYVCHLEWFGEERELEVVANDGECPLLGVGLLTGRDLHISYRSGNITIE